MLLALLLMMMMQMMMVMVMIMMIAWPVASSLASLSVRIACSLIPAPKVNNHFQKRPSVDDASPCTHITRRD